MPTVAVDDLEMYHEQYGAGRPLVLLHGAGSDHRVWAERAEPLADAFTVVVPDLRGHGYTGGSERETYTLDTYADDLQRLVEGLDLERPVVCGLSMGGMVALRHATRYPDATAGLVTLGTATPSTLSRREWFQDAVEPKLRDWGARLLGPARMEAAMHWAYERIYGEETVGDIEELERLQAAHDPEVPEMSESEAAKMDGALAGYGTMDLDYRAVTAPVLAMYGEREFPSMADHAARIAERVPDGNAREVPAAGHNSHVDNPDFVREAIRAFVRERVEGDGSR